jgi:hypothetical protein
VGPTARGQPALLRRRGHDPISHSARLSEASRSTALVSTSCTPECTRPGAGMKLAAYARAVSIDEMRRAERLTGRLLLGGLPNYPRPFTLRSGRTSRRLLDADLAQIPVMKSPSSSSSPCWFNRIRLGGGARRRHVCREGPHLDHPDPAGRGGARPSAPRRGLVARRSRRWTVSQILVMKYAQSG